MNNNHTLNFATLPTQFSSQLPPSLPKLKRYFITQLDTKPNLRERYLRLQAWDSHWTIRANRLSHRPRVADFFQLISRLGDGWIWATATLVATVYLQFTLQNAWLTFWAIYSTLLTSKVGYLLYKFLKTHTVRPRPYQVHQVIRLGERPLDVFSFPSGHTLQAVIFTIMLCHFVPWLGWILLPFTLLVAVSRMILGLHYPTDVAMGAVLGLGLAQLGLYCSMIFG